MVLSNGMKGANDMKRTAGIHHITAIVGDPQRNIDFYAGVLGLRLVKKTINFDRPEVYHLYFGDEGGNPGTIMTFFPWPKTPKGRIGTGQVGVTCFAVPQESLSFWEERLKKFKVDYRTATRFGETYLTFDDPDGLHIELVEREEGPPNPWNFGGILSKHAIKGFGGATLFSAKPHKTIELLEHVLGLECLGQEEDILRFKSLAPIGNIIDIKLSATVRGLMGAGTVHHIAWRAKDEIDHEEWRSEIQERGYHPTEILDRNYFKAMYFHEEGGILFEIATDPPGFTHDESKDELGSHLMLPSWLEPQREELESKLPPVAVRILEGDQS